MYGVMGDRVIVVLPDDASDDDRRAALALGATDVMSMAEFIAREPQDVSDLRSFTPAESGVLTELAHRPDTRSRLASRLGITTSTLDNHVASIKRKVLDDLATRGNSPSDGYLSMEALIGWAVRHVPTQET
jgi:DNA-binding CsgD family transcriptional regulator